MLNPESTGMSTVYRTTDLVTSRAIVLKVALETKHSKASLFNEAKILNTLLIEGVSRLLPLPLKTPKGIISNWPAVSQMNQNTVIYIALHNVLGRSLTLTPHLDWNPEWVSRTISKTAKILDQLHRNGWVHNDVKGSNLIQDAEKLRVTLIDFGTAIPQGKRAQIRSGTPGYLSPEYLFGDPVTGRSDQFSLAVLLLQWLGHPTPFFSKTLDEARRLAVDPAIRIQLAKELVDHPVRFPLLTALSVDPAKRFETLEEFSDEVSLMLRLTRFRKFLPI